MPSATIRHLTVEAVLALHEKVLEADGGASGVRAAALLESAVMAPQASLAGEPLMEDPVEIAAAYLFYLCRNHPFVDGNKRTALAACLVFLESNAVLAHPAVSAGNVDAWEAFVLEVAAGTVDREQTTVRLKRLLKRARRQKRSDDRE